MKSSGYGRPVDNSSRAMFRPKTNNTRAKKLNEASGGVKSLTPRGAQDDDAEAVGCCNNGNGRARWKKGLAITKKGEEEAAASAICRSPAEKNSPPPSRFCRSVRVWETSGAKTRLAFSTVASDGARGRRKLFSFPLATMAFGTTAVDNSTVRVFQRTEDLVEGREGLTLCHSDQVRGIDFSHSGDLLLTVGDADRTVKVWDWRKREVVVDIVSRKKKKKHAAKIFSLEVDNSSAPPIFPDVVVKSQVRIGVISRHCQYKNHATLSSSFTWTSLSSLPLATESSPIASFWRTTNPSRPSVTPRPSGSASASTSRQCRQSTGSGKWN